MCHFLRTPGDPHEERLHRQYHKRVEGVVSYNPGRSGDEDYLVGEDPRRDLRIIKVGSNAPA